MQLSDGCYLRATKQEEVQDGSLYLVRLGQSYTLLVGKATEPNCIGRNINETWFLSPFDEWVNPRKALEIWEVVECS